MSTFRVDLLAGGFSIFPFLGYPVPVSSWNKLSYLAAGCKLLTTFQRFHKTRSKVDTFIDRYIFPGGYLPSVRELIERLDTGSSGSLELDSVQSIGPHYARTLRLWRENFLANWETTKILYVKERGDMTPLDLEAFRRRWIVNTQSIVPAFIDRY